MQRPKVHSNFIDYVVTRHEAGNEIVYNKSGKHVTHKKMVEKNNHMVKINSCLSIDGAEPTKLDIDKEIRGCLLMTSTVS